MAAPIQNPAKCEVRSVMRFLNAKGERPAEIHKLFLFMVTYKEMNAGLRDWNEGI
jgi:hypothetical protein